MAASVEASRRPAVSPVRAAVTVVGGFRPAATSAVAENLLATAPGTVLVQHDLRQVTAGRVRRTLRTQEAVLADEWVTLVHGCVSCTLREDVLPTLVRLARADPDRGIVLALPEVVEPEAVAGACAHCLVDDRPVTDWLRFDSFLTVVDGASFTDDLASPDDLSDRGMQAAEGDDRSVADVLVQQIEFADTVLLWAPDREPYQQVRDQVLLHRLAPWAVQHTAVDPAGFNWHRLRGVDRHNPELPTPLARGLEGYLLGVHEPVSDCGVVSVVFRARRPLHPERFHRMLPDLAGAALRSRGHLWLANRPELVLGWESVGSGVAMGSLGRWLATVEDAGWDEASSTRRVTAAAEWDPYYGDRGNHLAVIGLDLDPVRLQRMLGACLLTDEELAGGEEHWRELPDPFRAT